jgi:hypothetical protein
VQKKSKGEVLTWYPPDLPGTYLLVRLTRLPPSDFSKMEPGNDGLWEPPTTEVEPGFSTLGGMLVPVLQLISPVCKTGTSLGTPDVFYTHC